jgi:hypothetical protein
MVPLEPRLEAARSPAMFLASPVGFGVDSGSHLGAQLSI